MWTARARRWGLRADPGRRLCGILPGAGGHCLPIPDGLSAVEAALPETCFTVWSNVFGRARLQAGETFAGPRRVQRDRRHRDPTGKSLRRNGSDDRRIGGEMHLLPRPGGRRAINYKTENWKDAVLKATNGKGVDVLLDMVAGDYIQDNIDVLALEGRYSLIAFLHGPKPK